MKKFPAVTYSKANKAALNKRVKKQALDPKRLDPEIFPWIPLTRKLPKKDVVGIRLLKKAYNKIEAVNISLYELSRHFHSFGLGDKLNNERFVEVGRAMVFMSRVQDILNPMAEDPDIRIV